MKPNRRASWGEHAMDGWYIKILPEHYRCHEIFVKTMRHTPISDTVSVKHNYITQLTVTPADAIVKALQNVKQAVLGKANHRGTANLQALTQMTDTFTPNFQLPSNNDARPAPSVQSIPYHQQ